MSNGSPEWLILSVHVINVYGSMVFPIKNFNACTVFHINVEIGKHFYHGVLSISEALFKQDAGLCSLIMNAQTYEER